MNRLPIRLRLALASALATAVVLGATGAFLYHWLGPSLDGRLLIVGLAALLLAALLGYGIAAAALRPVESIRAEAAAISGAEPGTPSAPPRRTR